MKAKKISRIGIIFTFYFGSVRQCVRQKQYWISTSFWTSIKRYSNAVFKVLIGNFGCNSKYCLNTHVRTRTHAQTHIRSHAHTHTRTQAHSNTRTHACLSEFDKTFWLKLIKPMGEFKTEIRLHLSSAWWVLVSTPYAVDSGLRPVSSAISHWPHHLYFCLFLDIQLFETFLCFLVRMFAIVCTIYLMK